MTFLTSFYSIICEKLCQDKNLDISHRSFLSSLWGVSSNNEIYDFLCNEPQEAMPFFDLLFFPDESIQLKIEPLLNSNPISYTTQSYLIDKLSSNLMTANIILDDSTKFSWQIDPMIIKNFVSRLNLTQKIPENIKKIFNNDDNFQWNLYVLLRSNNIIWTDECCEFIEKIIRSFFKDKELFGILTSMLKFCAECGYKGDFFDQLKKRKRQHVQNLHRHKHSQNLHERHSKEFLNSSGIRPVHVDVKKTNISIQIIDKVLNESFLTTECILPEDYVVTHSFPK